MSNKIDVAVLGLEGMDKTHVGAAKASPCVEHIYGKDTGRLISLKGNAPSPIA